ncbi:MAG: glycine cleavage system protein GcvH [Acetobacteraceae bacterium]|nr:glycine cleavage system protein GcvH [Acetobacteraceae bacterium]MCX7686035.1 glycine cleavage system protein GcvH [Acetobacteraceae bacterium]MDW8397587.1 glycine cleavage system protein GcvH [Acetobacteraceae bacterium]
MLRFTKDHEWIRLEDGVATVGITDHAQQALGDVVFVELPAPGREVSAGEAVAVVESVKAASDVYAPVAGRVVEANAALSADPGLVNRDPTGGGWFFRLSGVEEAALAGLMDEAAYAAFVENAA